MVVHVHDAWTMPWTVRAVSRGSELDCRTLRRALWACELKRRDPQLSDGLLHAAVVILARVPRLRLRLQVRLRHAAADRLRPAVAGAEREHRSRRSAIVDARLVHGSRARGNGKGVLAWPGGCGGPSTHWCRHLALYTRGREVESGGRPPPARIDRRIWEQTSEPNFLTHGYDSSVSQYTTSGSTDYGSGRWYTTPTGQLVLVVPACPRRGPPRVLEG